MSNSLIVSNKVKPLDIGNQGLPPAPWYAHRPLRTILYYVLLLETLSVQLPLRFLQFTLLPFIAKPHARWPLSKNLFAALLQHFSYYRRQLRIPLNNIDKSTLPRLTLEQDGATAVWIAPIHPTLDLHGYIKELFDAGGCSTTRIPAYWYGLHRGHGQDASAAYPAGPNERVVLFFHGGGYRELSALPSCPLLNNLRLILRASSASGKDDAPKRALAPEYRLTNETSFPGIVADALASWLYLVRTLHFKPENIILAGDSAGGHLALALLRYIRDERLEKGSPLADALIITSPWIDASTSFVNAGPSSSGDRFEGIDVLTRGNIEGAKLQLLKSLPMSAVYSAWMSPVTLTRDLEPDLFDGFPRSVCFFGELELLSDEIRAFAHSYNRAADEGRAGKLLLHGEPDGVHDYLAFTMFKAEQERALKILEKWI